MHDQGVALHLWCKQFMSPISSLPSAAVAVCSFQMGQVVGPVNAPRLTNMGSLYHRHPPMVGWDDSTASREYDI